MAISYDEACGAISEEPSAILYLDTCILLDIVRSPVRAEIDADSAKYARSLIARSHSRPRSIWLATSATVENEWHENIAEVQKGVEDEILRVELKRKHFLSAAKATTDFRYQHGQAESSLDLANKLRSVAESLLHSCLIISPSKEHILNAWSRVKRYSPPAKRGKAEPKDCEIYELFLGLCGELRARGASDRFVFVSSNTKDYGRDNSGGIQAELVDLNAQYTSRLAWAEAALDGRA
jgi:hypothetical protein